MKTLNTIRRIRTILTAPLLASGILLGSMGITDSAVAVAQPSDMGQCSSMTMTSAQGGANPSLMTVRARSMRPAVTTPRIPACR